MIQPAAAPGPIPNRFAQSAAVPGWAAAGLALSLYLGTAVAVFWSAWQAPTTRALGLGYDPVLCLWSGSWVTFAVGHGINPLLTNYIDFPAGANLTWTGLFPLAGLLMSPVTITAGPVVGYNLFVTLALALSAWTGFLAIRRYVPSDPAAFIGGLLYGFSPAVLAQWLGHPQIANVLLPPLMLLALDEILVRQRWASVFSGLILGMLAAIQLYLGEEMLAMEAIAATAGITLLVAARREEVAARAGHALGAIALAATVFGLLAAPLLAVQFFGPQRMTGGAVIPFGAQNTDLINFFVPTPLQLFSGPGVGLYQKVQGNIAEWDGYLGIPLLGLLVFSARRYRDQLMMRLQAVLALLLSVLSMGMLLRVAGAVAPVPVAAFALGLPALRRWFPVTAMVPILLIGWAALIGAPLLHNVLPARLMVLVFLFAGFLIAALVNEELRRPRHRRSGAVLALVALALLLLVPRLPYSTVDASTPTFFMSEVRKIVPSGSVALIAPFSRSESVMAMLWQAQSGFVFKMPEGYAIIPAPHGSRISGPDSELGDAMAAVEDCGAVGFPSGELAQMRLELARWRVETVIVGPMAHRQEMVDFLRSLLGRPPQRVGGVELWQGGLDAVPA